MSIFARFPVRPRPSGIAVLAALVLVSPALAQSAPGTSARPLPPLPLDTFTLANGLKVVVSEDHSTPVVAVDMWYHVGSAHEPPGRSGFAHLFEHMLFQETENLEEGAMDRLVTRAGGVYNATTSQDRTAYYEVLPANRLNLALWLHAERMARLVVDAEAFETEREVVKEERRQRIDNQPYGQAQLVLDTLSQEYGPYRHTTIGSMADLEAASVEEVEAFYRRYYVPSNAVLTVVGDVTVDRVRELAERYLGDIDPGEPAPSLPEPPPVPRQGEAGEAGEAGAAGAAGEVGEVGEADEIGEAGGGRRATVPDPFAQLPLLWMAWSIPPADHPDQYALDLLSTVFSTGESSRLQQRLVDEEQAALDVVSFLDARVGPGTFRVGALPNQGVDVARLEELIDEEIQRLREEGITARELEKAVNQQRSSLVTQRLTVQSKASALQWQALHHGTPFHILGEMERYGKVTLDDVRRVARTYLVPGNRTVVIAVPQRGGEGGGP